MGILSLQLVHDMDYNLREKNKTNEVTATLKFISILKYIVANILIWKITSWKLRRRAANVVV